MDSDARADAAPTIYTTSWCGYCRRLKADLGRRGIHWTEVDIEEHPEAAAVVERINHGNRTVPTVVYADGSAATNPSGIEVQNKLKELAG